VTVIILILALSACQGSENGDQASQLTSSEQGQLSVPVEYANLVNPLPLNAETIRAGEQIYLVNCATCHGETGKGDGPVARALTPKPSDLALVSTSVDDAYLYWRIAKGGGVLNSSMPAWKSILVEDEIWMVVAFIHNLPNK
jgi:mono/diheme cytochrome c family protein